MNKRKRPAREVINQAVLENKANERLLYAFAAGFIAVGLSVLVWAVFTRAIILAGIGALTSSLFWPAVEFVRRTRRENMAIRLLETPLSLCDNATEAFEMLQRLFNETIRDKQPMESKDPSKNVASVSEQGSNKAKAAQR
jgi:hypothetical protein